MKNTMVIAAVFVLAMVSQDAAASVSTGGLPWEDPLKTLVDSLKGPVAVGIGIVGFVVAGAMLMFGSEFGEIGKRTTIMALVVSMLVLAANFLPALFGTSGSIVDPMMIAAVGGR